MSKKSAPDAVEEAKVEKQPAADSALDKKMAKGAIMLAPSKNEKEQSVFTSTQHGKKKGRKQKAQTSELKEGTLDFSIVKKFSTLKISAPVNPEEFERALKELQDIRECLIYWGKIIQRQNKIKFIRNSKKISKEEDFLAQADEEEKFIESEKQIYQGDDTQSQKINPDKLKMA